MSGTAPISWASLASSNISSSAQNGTQQDTIAPRRRSPAPSHIPQTTSEDETLYVLTLLTDQPLHERMTSLREKYFPKRINKLAAHLTLFHALPESKLNSRIIPAIIDVASTTAAFKVHVEEPFRMKKGFAISVSNQVGGRQAEQIHRQLQQPWRDEGFLSEQDAGECRVHYTLMNKVDDEMEVAKAFGEVTASWKGDEGVAEGLGLWRYDRGFWRWQRKFEFSG